MAGIGWGEGIACKCADRFAREQNRVSRQSTGLVTFGLDDIVAGAFVVAQVLQCGERLRIPARPPTASVDSTKAFRAVIKTAAPLYILVLLLVLWIVYLRRKNSYLAYITTVKDQEREAVLTFLNRMGEAFTRDIKLDETLSMIGEFIIEETMAESGAIYLYDADREFLSARVVVGLFPPMHETLSHVLTKKKYLEQKVKSERIKRGESIIGLAAESGRSYLIPDATADSRVPSAAHSVVPMRSMMVCPLRVRGKVLGVMAVLNKQTGESFDLRDMGLLQALADQAAVTVNIVALYGEIAEKQRIEQELSLARDFQRLLLPKENPTISGWDFAGVSRPALEVGGDYYDFIKIDDRHLGFCVADVSGKGIPGGLVMAAARSTLRAEARVSLSPREVLTAVNHRILRDTGENVFITMTYGVLDVTTGEMVFARAGHDPTLVLQTVDGKTSVASHSPTGIALGLVDTEVFQIIEDQRVQLADDEVVVLYTDGVTEAMNNRDEEFGMERLSKTLVRCHHRSCQALIDGMLEDIQAFAGDYPQHDDITVIAFGKTSAELGEAAKPGAPRGALDGFDD